MEPTHFEEARKAEESYHHQFYQEHEILEPGSWMANPTPIVMELLDRLLLHKKGLHVLDLGCGAGRNTIPLAVRLKDTDSKVVGLDLLDEAIEKLKENAVKYEVANLIVEVKGDAEHAAMPEKTYDYIVALGCLEHVSSEQAFVQVIERMKLATKVGGIHCLMMNTDIQEVERDTGRALETLIELNLPTDKALSLLKQAYQGWNVLEQGTMLHTIEEEKYDKPTEFRCQSLTFAVQKLI